MKVGFLVYSGNLMNSRIFKDNISWFLLENIKLFEYYTNYRSQKLRWRLKRLTNKGINQKPTINLWSSIYRQLNNWNTFHASTVKVGTAYNGDYEAALILLNKCSQKSMTRPPPLFGLLYCEFPKAVRKFLGGDALSCTIIGISTHLFNQWILKSLI
jgi:hypothetical protein